jgi:hypothetical protein
MLLIVEISAKSVEERKRNDTPRRAEQCTNKSKALGWPEQILDATRAQLQSITKMQIQIMDQMMDIWQEQIKSPNPMTATSAMLSKLKSLPGASPAGHLA